MLLQLGCELAQGFYIARPMPAEKLVAWREHWLPDEEWIKQQPVSRDDLPLLFAAIEHRSWIRAVNNYVKDKSSVIPPLDHHQCRFGNWLIKEGKNRYCSHPAFHNIEYIHQQIHSLAKIIIDLYQQGKVDSSLKKLKKIYVLRDDLLQQLSLLLIK